MTLVELDGENWVDHEDPLTDREKVLLNSRLTVYAKDPDAGSTWAEVEGRIQAALATSRTDEKTSNHQTPRIDPSS